MPVALEETLTAGVNALVEPPCLPAIPTDTTPTSSVPAHGKKHEHGHHDKGGD